MSVEKSIADMYKDGLSPYEIAEKLGDGWYALKIRRLLTKMGVPLRDKSMAAKQAMTTGRSVSPTKGKTLSADVKKKIGASVSKNWEEMDDAEREKRSQIAKSQWNAMSDDKRADMQAKATKGILKASTYGSKMEKHIVAELAKDGYELQFHSRLVFPTGQKLEVDIFLPKLKTCIEIDGRSHFEPIWGDEAFARTQASDMEKNGLAITNGYNVIRLKVVANTVTEVYKEKIYNKLKEVLARLNENHNLPVEQRLIYID